MEIWKKNSKRKNVKFDGKNILPQIKKGAKIK